MPGVKEYKLEQVSVRLKLMEEAPLYSTDKIDTPDRAIEIMSDMMKSLDREHVCVVNLDGASHPINFNVVSMGSINMSPVVMSEVFKTAILSNATRILLLHNHPSSSITPSKEDHSVTAKVMMASMLMGIPLVDHIIVGGGTGEYFSYKKELRGMFNAEGMQTLLKTNGIEGVFAEPAIEYESGKRDIPDLGPKRVEEGKTEGGYPRSQDIINNYRAGTEQHFRDICGMNAGEIEAFVKAEAERIFEDYEMDVKIVDAVIYGSRSRGLEKDGSDLDVVLEYEGTEPEEAVFGVLNEEKLMLGDIRVDIKPITAGISGTLEEFLPRAEEQLKQVIKAEQDYKPLAKVEELEEENYNQIDNHLNNTKPRAEEIREQKQEAEERKRRTSSRSRPSLLARMREKQSMLEARKKENKTPKRLPKEERIV